jgi:hypothetical protein
MDKLGLDLGDVHLDEREILIMQLRNEVEKEKASLKGVGDLEKIKYIKDLEQQLEETVDTMATEKGSSEQWNLFGFII